jgi:hypothetical protein
MITVFLTVLLVSFVYIGGGALYIYYTEKSLEKPVEMWVQVIMLVLWPILSLIVFICAVILYIAERLNREA